MASTNTPAEVSAITFLNVAGRLRGVHAMHELRGAIDAFARLPA